MNHSEMGDGKRLNWLIEFQDFHFLPGLDFPNWYLRRRYQLEKELVDQVAERQFRSRYQESFPGDVYSGGQKNK